MRCTVRRVVRRAEAPGLYPGTLAVAEDLVCIVRLSCLSAKLLAGSWKIFIYRFHLLIVVFQ